MVAELFSSEGCSSCPQAERALAALDNSSEIEVLALERHVDYWNSMGWVDPFSTAEATPALQRGDSLRGWGVYTPQLIVDGVSAFSSGAKLPSVVGAAAKKPLLAVTVSLKGRFVEAKVTDLVKAARIELYPKYEVANLAVVAVARDSEAGPITAVGRVSVVSARTPTH